VISDQELRRKLDEIKDVLEIAKASSLDADAQEPLRRAQAIVEELRSTISEPARRRSIMDLEGVGAKFWSKIDVEAYIRKERESWD
jgi:L-lysine 2,3-aminomutase